MSQYPDEPVKKTGNTKVELPPVTERIDTESPATNKVRGYNDPVNMELFYNQQITNLNMSWLLRHTKSNLCIAGIMQEQAYGFTVDNQYSSGIGGMLAETLKKVEGVVGTMQKSNPVINQTFKPGGWGEQLGNKLTGWGNDIEEVDGGTVGGWLQNTAKEALTGAGNAITGFVQGADQVRHSHDNMASKFLSAFFEGNKVGISDLTNGKFITSVDKVMTYSGSNLSITLPQLKTIIFHNPVSDQTNVLDMTDALLEQMAPYMQQSTIEGLYALQRSPGGYEVDLNVFEGQDHPIRGTWTLYWNGYEMKNLLISKLDVSYSKYNAMNRQGLDSGDPLYAEVDISVIPASMIMTYDVKKIMCTTKQRKRKDLSGWKDSDESEIGVTSKNNDVTSVAIVNTNSNNADNSTSYDRK